MSRNTMKTSLSHGLLGMRFMQKSKEKIRQQAEEQESQNLYANAITDAMKRGEVLFVIQPSRGACEEVTKGHFSFGGFHPEIERQMAEDEALESSKNDLKKEKSVSDTQMAEHFTSFSHNLKEKFKKVDSKAPSFYKTDHKSFKPYNKQFIKPKDD